MTTEEVLAGAADLLEKRGWCQNITEDSAGRLCLVGALRKMAPGDREYFSARAAVCQELHLSEREMKLSAHIDWNNAPGRTAEEVITTLRNSKRFLHDG